MTDKEKIIQWFSDIAEMCSRLTTGNVSHLGATIRGKAIRAAEYMEKHSIPEESGCEVNCATKSENLVKASQEYAENHFQDFIETEDDPGYWCSRFGFIAGAEWQKQKDFESDMSKFNECYEKGRFDMREEMMKDAVDAIIFSELKGSDGSVFQAKSDRFKMDGAKISDKIKVMPIKTEQQ